MLLKTLTYQDKTTGWTLQNLELDRFNLLVGASGVGKTRILRAIQALCAITREGGSQNAVSFTLGFEHEQQSYTWEFESTLDGSGTSVETSSRSARKASAGILREKLTPTGEGPLVLREQGKFFFRGKELPQLNRAETALVLLDEPSIQSVRHAFISFILNDRGIPGFPLTEEKQAQATASTIGSLENLRALVRIPVAEKAYVLQRRFPAEFEHLKSLFIEIFPSVQDVAVDQVLSSHGLAWPSITRFIDFRLKEHDVPGWIASEDFSSGMHRTLSQLIHLWLAPAGTVVLIDEFENSLGVNCMGPLTEFIQSRASELQFIITSHHPYIINKIPKSHWKVVRRKGSVVRVTPASEIKALQGTSAQDDFTRLLNSPEFEEGLA